MEKVCVNKGIFLKEAIKNCIKFLETSSKSRKKDIFLIKPNLVTDAPPPITTPTDIVEEIVKQLKLSFPKVHIIIGEGSASVFKDTWQVFSNLGYTDLASRLGVELVDLNTEPLIHLKDTNKRIFKEIWLPKVLFEAYVLSVPVLKAHTLAEVTLTMKNMIGVLPPKFYQEQGHWKKSYCHRELHTAILELNQYKSPDFTILDARRGLAKSHLSGPELNPPPDIIAASPDPVSIDAFGARLLGKDWRKIGHINPDYAL